MPTPNEHKLKIALANRRRRRLSRANWWSEQMDRALKKQRAQALAKVKGALK